MTVADAAGTVTVAANAEPDTELDGGCVVKTSFVAAAPPVTLMQLLAVTLCPSGLTMVTFCKPPTLAVMFNVTWVGEL